MFSGTLSMAETRASIGLIAQLGAFDGVVQVRDVGRMVLVVMDFHRLRVDVRFQGVERIRQIGNGIGHGLGLPKNGELCRTGRRRGGESDRKTSRGASPTNNKASPPRSIPDAFGAGKWGEAGVWNLWLRKRNPLNDGTTAKGS